MLHSRQIFNRPVECLGVSQQDEVVAGKQLKRRLGGEEAAAAATHSQHRHSELLPERYVGNAMSRPHRGRSQADLAKAGRGGRQSCKRVHRRRDGVGRLLGRIGVGPQQKISSFLEKSQRA